METANLDIGYASLLEQVIQSAGKITIPAQDTWEGAQPTYYLELETTKEAYDEKFYMGGAQFNRVIPTTKNPRVKSANQRTISDARPEAAAREGCRRHLRRFARFQPRGQNRP